MVWLVVSEKRRRQLVVDASVSRSDRKAAAVALAVVIFYNLIGVLDIVSTTLAIGLGRAEEVNPILKALMDELGAGWIVAKIALQTVISFMVLWFPHRFVLVMFALAIGFNTLVVMSNFRIAAGY